MDDGLQNPTVVHDISFLVVDGATGLGNGCLIPAGPLRETLADALKRVTAVVMIGEDKHNVRAQIHTKPVVRATLEPRLPDSFPKNVNFIAFSGIARPGKFFATCAALDLNVIDKHAFPDHHPFNRLELSNLLGAATKQGAQLLTTEKDWVRLPEHFRAQTNVLPVALVFEDETVLYNMVK
jgi:tetraacyldisaccharide 4'-kinase